VSKSIDFITAILVSAIYLIALFTDKKFEGVQALCLLIILFNTMAIKHK
jgi:hypothetical protein